MNIKQIKSVLIKIWAIVFLVLFSTWLIGGCIYNSIGKESIQEDIQQLKQELYSIKPIQNYFVKNVALANRRAIIAKSLRANILPITTEYTSELTLYEFERYFIRNGWDIVEYRKRPSLHIKASNEKYVVTLDLISSMNDEWRIQIGYNNFFEKYNFNITISLDGPEEIHNTNRRFAYNGEGSYSSIIKNLSHIKNMRRLPSVTGWMMRP